MPRDNQTMLQCFEWYLPADGSLWRQVAQMAPRLARDGFTALWLPPAYKGASGSDDVGYGVYDLYDLGEFAQKGTVPTKYGTRQEYLEAIAALHRFGVAVYADIVLDHMMGADETEEVPAVRYDPGDRQHPVGQEQTICAWTKFTFPGRGGKYADFCWDWHCFDGTDWDEAGRCGGIYKFHGKQWDGEVDRENGNYDYLMGADLDLGNEQVLAALTQWGKWYLQTTGVDGLRLDAVKHMRFDFYTRWLCEMAAARGETLPAVGEYWHADCEVLEHYLQQCGGCMRLFDVPLHYKFYTAGQAGGSFDMGSLPQDTLSCRQPQRAVTFVDNHDTQPGQALQSFVPRWFKPLAYAYILLRQEGIPCVFYGDYFGIPHDGIPPLQPVLGALVAARRDLAYGPQHDYFDHADIVGFTREGDSCHPGSGLACLLSDGPGGEKRMYIGTAFAGCRFYDLLGGRPDTVTVGGDGYGTFSVGGGAAAVWGLCP